jgi:hypothetical protein
MIPGVRGGLVSGAFARDVLPDMPEAVAVPARIETALVSWSLRIDDALGIASSVRTVADIAAVPLLDVLGLAIERRIDDAARCVLQVRANATRIVVIVSEWGEPLERTWRSSVIHAIAGDARWCLCCNGRAVRLVDARRTWSREYLEFDCLAIGREPMTQQLLWTLLRAEALNGEPPLIDRVVDLSRRHGVTVCQVLGDGVLSALALLVETLATGTHAAAMPVLFEQSLTVLYRVLFLLFAEARGLLPLWHPVYRDRYSLDTIVTTLLRGQRYRGLWQAVQAISRVAHAGCNAGELRVTAFNGRLFLPSQADVFDRTPITDEVMGQAVVAVSTTPIGGPNTRTPPARDGASGRTRPAVRARIVYRDLDVEQLGAVYERVLEYQPASDRDATLLRTREVRKSSGTFYTPRALTGFLVRQTLGPLVRGRRADEILQLTVLDPAMGSGAFLVAACRYLSAVVEEALIAEGTWHAHDVTAADRAALRREVASRCLFGVDVNPMAVQLARLSLWLATLATDKPLSFLDHHLVAGNSLVGASPADVRRQPGGGGSARGRRHEDLPLFPEESLSSVMGHAIRIRLQLTAQPDDTAAIVREKERTLAGLQARESSLATWSRLLDLWCAGWFWAQGSPPDHRTVRELTARLIDGGCALPERMSSELLKESDAVAASVRFHHWPLVFPEIFLDERGGPRGVPGFDAVIGNPPWEMVRGDSGGGDTRATRKTDARRLTDFVRESGIYRVEPSAHANLYQLFLERALQLVRRGGRIGLVLPSGLVSDAGSASLRRHLFDRADVEAITGLDNREAIFTIHRSTRFVLLTCTPGGPTQSIRCRFGITRVEDLEKGETSAGSAIVLTRAFLERLSGAADLGIPELTTPRDLAIVERIAARVPRLGEDTGWCVQFSRELNASDDRDAFMTYTNTADARPVVEGKQIDPFRVSLDRCRLQLDPRATMGRAVPHRARLAYRDVASATNRLTLIAAIIPARAVTTHTLFCLRTRLSKTHQRVLCALLNSFVANYLIRLRVNTHVTATLMSQLPVPVIGESDRLFEELHTLSTALSHSTTPVEEMEEYAQLQALCAYAYQLTASEFEHVLGTFPLIPTEVRAAALAAFNGTH